MITFLVGFFVGSGSSIGALPPSAYLVKRWVDRRAEVPSVLLQNEVADVDAAGVLRTRFRSSCLVLFSERELRCLAYNDAAQVIYRHYRKIPGFTAKGAGAPALVHFLFEQDLNLLSLILIKHKVPIRTEQALVQLKSEKLRRESETVYLKRNTDQVVWAIGGRTGTSEPTGTLWVDRGTLLPLRLGLVGAEGAASEFAVGGVTEFEFNFQSNRGGTFKGFAYPGEIRIKTASGAFQEKLIKMGSPPTKAQDYMELKQGWTPQGESVASAVRNLVEQYYGVFR